VSVRQVASFRAMFDHVAEIRTHATMHPSIEESVPSGLPCLLEIGRISFSRSLRTHNQSMARLHAPPSCLHPPAYAHDISIAHVMANWDTVSHISLLFIQSSLERSSRSLAELRLKYASPPPSKNICPSPSSGMKDTRRKCSTPNSPMSRLPSSLFASTPSPRLPLGSTPPSRLSSSPGAGSKTQTQAHTRLHSLRTPLVTNEEYERGLGWSPLGEGEVMIIQEDDEEEESDEDMDDVAYEQSKLGADEQRIMQLMADTDEDSCGCDRSTIRSLYEREESHHHLRPAAPPPPRGSFRPRSNTINTFSPDNPAPAGIGTSTKQHSRSRRRMSRSKTKSVVRVRSNSKSKSRVSWVPNDAVEDGDSSAAESDMMPLYSSSENDPTSSHANARRRRNAKRSSHKRRSGSTSRSKKGRRPSVLRMSSNSSVEPSLTRPSVYHDDDDGDDDDDDNESSIDDGSSSSDFDDDDSDGSFSSCSEDHSGMDEDNGEECSSDESLSNSLSIHVGPIVFSAGFVEFVEREVAGVKTRLSEQQTITFLAESLKYNTSASDSVGNRSKEEVDGDEDASIDTSPYPLLGRFGATQVRLNHEEFLTLSSWRFGGSLSGLDEGKPDVCLDLCKATMRVPWEHDIGKVIDEVLVRWKGVKMVKKTLKDSLPPLPAVSLGQDDDGGGTSQSLYPPATGLDLSSLWLRAPNFVVAFGDSAADVDDRRSRWESLSDKQKKEEHELRKRFEHEEEEEKEVVQASDEHVTNAPAIIITSPLSSPSIDVAPAASPSTTVSALQSASTSASSSLGSVEVGEEGEMDDFQTPLKRTTTFMSTPTRVTGQTNGIQKRMTSEMLSANTPSRYGTIDSSQHPSPASSTFAASIFTPSRSPFPSPSVASTQPMVTLQPMSDNGSSMPEQRPPLLHTQSSPLSMSQKYLVPPVLNRPVSAMERLACGGEASSEPPNQREEEKQQAPIVVPSLSFLRQLERSGLSAAEWITFCSSSKMLHSSGTALPRPRSDSPSSSSSSMFDDASFPELMHLTFDLLFVLRPTPDLLDPAMLRRKVHELDSTTRTPYAKNENGGSDPNDAHTEAISSKKPLGVPTGHFRELWGREISLRCTRVLARLRDYPIPILSSPSLRLGGTAILGAMDCPALFSKRRTMQLLGGTMSDSNIGETDDTKNVDSVSIELVSSSRVPLKLYHDLCLHLDSPHLTYGPCLLQAFDALSRTISGLTSSSGDITAGSSSSSSSTSAQPTKIDWWDNMRYLCHGKFILEMWDVELRLLANPSMYVPTFLHLAAASWVISFTNGQTELDVSDLSVSCVLHHSEWNPRCAGIVFLPGSKNPLLWKQYAQGRLMEIPRTNIKVSYTWKLMGEKAASKAKSSSSSSPDAKNAGEKVEREPYEQSVYDSIHSHYIHHEFLHRQVQLSTHSTSRSSKHASKTSKKTLLDPSKVFDSFRSKRLEMRVECTFNPPEYSCAWCHGDKKSPSPSEGATTAEESDPTTKSDAPPQPPNVDSSPLGEQMLTNIPYVTARWWAVRWLQDVLQLFASPPDDLLPVKSPRILTGSTMPIQRRSFGSVVSHIQLSCVAHALRFELLHQTVMSGGLSRRNGMNGAGGLLLCVGHVAYDCMYVSKPVQASSVAEPSPANESTETECPKQRQLALQEPACDMLQASMHILVPSQAAPDATASAGNGGVAVLGVEDDETNGPLHRRTGSTPAPVPRRHHRLDSFAGTGETFAFPKSSGFTPTNVKDATTPSPTPSPSLVTPPTTIPGVSATTHAKLRHFTNGAHRRVPSRDGRRTRMAHGRHPSSTTILNFVDGSGKFVSPFDRKMDGKEAVFLASCRMLALRGHYTQPEATANPWCELTQQELDRQATEARRVTKELPFDMTVRLPPRESQWKQWFGDLMQTHDEEEEAEEDHAATTSAAQHIFATIEGARRRAATPAAEEQESAKGAAHIAKAMTRLGIVTEDLVKQPEDFTSNGTSAAMTGSMPGMRTFPGPGSSKRRVPLLDMNAIDAAAASSSFSTMQATTPNTAGLITTTTGSFRAMSRRTSEIRRHRTKSINALLDTLITGATAEEASKILHQPWNEDEDDDPRAAEPSVSRLHLPISPQGAPGSPSALNGDICYVLGSPIGKLPALHVAAALLSPVASSYRYGVTRGRSPPCFRPLDYSACSFRNLVVNLKILWSSSTKKAVGRWSGLMHAPHPSTMHIHMHASGETNNDAQQDEAGEDENGEQTNEENMNTQLMRQHRSASATDDGMSPYMLSRGRQASAGALPPPFPFSPRSGAGPATPNSRALNTPSRTHRRAGDLLTPYSSHSPKHSVSTSGNSAMSPPMSPIGRGRASTGDSSMPRMSDDMSLLLEQVDNIGTIEASDRVDEEHGEGSDFDDYDSTVGGLHTDGLSSLRTATALARRDQLSEWLTLFELDLLRPQINFENPSSTSRLILSASRARLETQGLPVKFVLDNPARDVMADAAALAAAFPTMQTTTVSDQNQQRPHSGGSTSPNIGSPYIAGRAARGSSVPNANEAADGFSPNARLQRFPSSNLLPPPPMSPGHVSRLSLASPRLRHYRSSSMASTSALSHISESSSNGLGSSCSSLDAICQPLYFEKRVSSTLLGAQAFVVPAEVDLAGSLTWVNDSMVEEGEVAMATSLPTAHAKHHSVASSESRSASPVRESSRVSEGFEGKSSTGRRPSISASAPPPSISSRSFKRGQHHRTGSHLHGKRNVLRRVVEPTMLHYARSQQQDIDDELLRRGLGILDDINGVSGWASEVKRLQRVRAKAHAKAAKQEASALGSAAASAASRTPAHQRSMFISASSSCSSAAVQSEPFIPSPTTRRVLRDSNQLFLPNLSAHMDSSEYKTLISVVHSVLLSLNDRKHDAAKQFDAQGRPIYPVPPMQSKQEQAELQKIIEEALESSSSTVNGKGNGGDESSGKGSGSNDSSNGRRTNRSMTPSSTPARNGTNGSRTFLSPPPTELRAAQTMTSTSTGQPIVQSRVEYFVGRINWEMVGSSSSSLSIERGGSTGLAVGSSSNKGFVQAALQSLAGEHTFFADLSRSVHFRIQHLSLTSKLLAPTERHYHLIRPDPVPWSKRDTKRDMMVQVRAIVREPLGTKNPLLHYVTAYDHFELTLFPLVVCLPHDHALLLRDYFIPELARRDDPERAKAEAELKQATQVAKAKMEREKDLEDKKRRTTLIGKDAAMASSSSTSGHGSGSGSELRLFNPKEQRSARNLLASVDEENPNANPAEPTPNTGHGSLLSPDRKGALVPASAAKSQATGETNEQAQLAARAKLIPSIKYFKYLRLNHMDFTFSFKHESRSLFTFENVHLLISPFTRSKKVYCGGWGELFGQVEKHVVYSVIQHGTEIIAQKIGIRGGRDASEITCEQQVARELEEARVAKEKAEAEFVAAHHFHPVPYDPGAVTPSTSTAASSSHVGSSASFSKKILGLFSGRKSRAAKYKGKDNGPETKIRKQSHPEDREREQQEGESKSNVARLLNKPSPFKLSDPAASASELDVTMPQTALPRGSAPPMLSSHHVHSHSMPTVDLYPAYSLVLAENVTSSTNGPFSASIFTPSFSHPTHPTPRLLISPASPPMQQHQPQTHRPAPTHDTTSTEATVTATVPNTQPAPSKQSDLTSPPIIPPRPPRPTQPIPTATLASTTKSHDAFSADEAKR